MSSLNWKKSRRCETANCVEVATAPGVVLVRDTKSPSDGVLRFTSAAWTAFVAAVPTGRFDGP